MRIMKLYYGYLSQNQVFTGYVVSSWRCESLKVVVFGASIYSQHHMATSMSHVITKYRRMRLGLVTYEKYDDRMNSITALS